MSRIVIEKKISLSPAYLDEKVETHLHDRLQELFADTCDQNHGYVLKVYDKIQILDNTISSSGKEVFFNVRFGIKALKPEVGSEYTGKVCMIFSSGVFVEVAKMKVLVPTAKMDGYKYLRRPDGLTEFKKGNLTIRSGDRLKISIEMTRYERRNFNCIGKLILVLSESEAEESLESVAEN